MPYMEAQNINTYVFSWRVCIFAGRHPANLNILVYAVQLTVRDIAFWLLQMKLSVSGTCMRSVSRHKVCEGVSRGIGGIMGFQGFFSSRYFFILAASAHI